MRRTRWAGLAVAAVALALIASTPALGAGTTVKPGAQQGEWRGKTEQGTRVIFDVLQTRRGLVVQPQDVEVFATCDVSGDQLELGFGGGQLRLHQDGTFKIRFYDPFFGDLRFAGTLGDTEGTGTASFALAGLLRNGGLQLCASGDVSWKAHAPTFGSSPAGAGRPDYRIHVSQDRLGHLTWTVTQG
jgi:hypothetical protein